MKEKLLLAITLILLISVNTSPYSIDITKEKPTQEIIGDPGISNYAPTEGHQKPFKHAKHRYEMEPLSSSGSIYLGLNVSEKKVGLFIVNDSYRYLFWSDEGYVVGVYPNSTSVLYNKVGDELGLYKLIGDVLEGCVFEDFDGDGIAEIVLADYVSSMDTVNIYIFDVENFYSPYIYNFVIEYNPSHLNLTQLDVDGDGFLEVALILWPKIFFFDITFVDSEYFVSQINSTAVALDMREFLSIDFGGDGSESLLIGLVNNSEYVLLEISLMGGDIHKSNISISLPSPDEPHLSSGDFDGDGDDDLSFAYMVNDTHANITLLSDLFNQISTNIIDLADSEFLAKIIESFSFDYGSDGILEPSFIYLTLPSNKYVVAYLNTTTFSLEIFKDLKNYLSYAVFDRNLDNSKELSLQLNSTKGNWIEVYFANRSLMENYTTPEKNFELVGGAEIDEFYGKFFFSYRDGYCIVRNRSSSAKLVLDYPSAEDLYITKNGSVKVAWSTYINGTPIRISVKTNGTETWFSNQKFNYSITVNVTKEGIYNISIHLKAVDIEEITVYFYASYDKTPPTINALRPQNSTYINSNEITIEWNISDNVKFSNATILLNGTTITTSNKPKGTKNVTNLTEGAWNITIIAYDLAGNKAKKENIFIIDTTPPSLEITKPKNNSYTGGEINIEFYALDRWGLEKIEVYDNNTLKKILPPYTTTTTLSGLEDGLHKITVIAYDKAGNTNSSKINIYVDTTPPNITIYTANESRVKNPFNISFNVEDENFETLTIHLNGTKILTYNATNLTNIVEINYPYGGWINITFTAIDKANNTSQKTLLVYVDVEAPTIEIKEPENRTITNKTTITITWETNHTDIDKIKVYINNTHTRTLEPENKTFTVELNEGKYEIKLIARDLAGNTYTTEILIIVDLTPPKFEEINYPKYTNTTNPILEVNTSDNINIGKIEVKFGNTIILFYNNSFALSIGLDEGNNTIIIRAIDKGGNKAEATIWIIVDLEKPKLTIISPKNNTYTNSSTIEVVIEYSDEESGIYEVSIHVNDSAVYKGFYKSVVVSLNIDGIYIIKVHVKDLAGNTNTTTVIVYRDTTKPRLIEISPKNGSLLPARTQLSFMVDDFSPIEAIVLAKNETIFKGNGTKDVTIEISLKEGINVLTIVVRDRAGNSAEYVLIYTSDQRAPTIQVEPKGGKFVVGEEIEFKINASDDYGLSRIDVYVDGEYIGSLVSEKTTFSWEFVEAGIHRITFQAIDLVGNKETLVVVLEIVEKTTSPWINSSATIIPIMITTSAIIGLLYGYLRRKR